MRVENEMRRKIGPRAFTLIELLVVVAVIAVLAAMLLPALAKARARARQTACMQNLRQVAVGIQLLADDNDGWCDPNHIGTNYWTSAMSSYIPQRLAQALYPTVATDGILLCPNYKLSPGTPFIYGVFGLNTAFADYLWPPLNYVHNMREVFRPATTHLVAEYTDPSTSRGPSMFDATCIGPASGWNYSARHEGRGLNFVFVDGHGEFVPYIPTTYGSLWWQANTVTISTNTAWNGYGNQMIWGP